MLAEAAGGSAWLEEGTYLFNEPLVVPPSTTLDGRGTLKVADHANLPSTVGALTLGSNCTVRGITVDGNKTKQAGEGAMILGVQVSGVAIIGVSVRNAPWRSIYLYRCANSQIDGCHIEKGGLTEATDGTRASISTLHSSHVRVANNSITGCAGEGIFLVCGDSSVANNVIRDTHSIGIAVGDGQQRNIVISNNHIQINHTWLSGDSPWPNCIDVGDSRNCIVAGNIMEGGACGVANAPPSYRTTVIDNTCSRALTAGIAMGGAGSLQPLDLVISGNRCIGNGGEGIAVSYVAGTEVRDNECMDNGQSEAYPHNAGITVYGDDVHGYVNGLAIEGNRCGDQQAKKSQLYGLVIQGGRHTNISVSDNDLRGNAFSAVGDTSNPGSAVFSGNLG